MAWYWVVLMVAVAFYAGGMLLIWCNEKKCKLCQAELYEQRRNVVWTDESFLIDVFLEIRRARKKHPGNAHLTAALMEEVGELAKAQLEGESQARIWAEAMQVACVAARIAMEGDRDFMARDYASDGALADIANPQPVAPLSFTPESDWPDPPSRARVGGAA